MICVSIRARAIRPFDVRHRPFKETLMNLRYTLHTALIVVSAILTAQFGEPDVSGRGRALAEDTPTVKRDAAWVDKRIEDWQPTKAERAFDEIGWAKDLGEARRLAERHGRPIFLFTYDGADLACYRC
jgi:hypothetical protein